MTAPDRSASDTRLAEADARAVRVGGRGALLAGIVFLVTIAYTFGFLFPMGLSTDMLNVPAQLLPWVHAHTVAYIGLWWIFVLHLICLLPAPAGLAWRRSLASPAPSSA